MLGYKLPKDDQKYQWTNHVKDKMLYYRISESLIKRIVRFPKRLEVGIAPNTVAVMIPRVATTRSKGKSGKKTEELWVMYQELNQNPEKKNQQLVVALPTKKRIISTWRYPGTSPVGKKIPIPDEILQELDALLD